MSAQDGYGDQPPPMNEVVQQVLFSFEDPKFQYEVATFVNLNLEAFAQPCLDGSQPHEWMYAHRKYRKLFEDRLQQSIAETGADMSGFTEYFEQCLHYYGNDPTLGHIISRLTQSEDYNEFLQVMFAAVRENWVPDEPSAKAEYQLHQVSVLIPDGLGPGMTLMVDYLGFQHQVVIPEGYAPGMELPCTLQVPALSGVQS
mmetsp:Transcript_6125/g.14636  ORF Transcript_6125/g.14636 Transcript_6125/m.14636 type:complete len:200 (-) Transcript_6125:65-664(-)